MSLKSKGRVLIVVVLTCLLAGLGVGCSSSSEKLVEVKGKVTYGAKPLTTGVVIYHPNAAKGNTSKVEARGSLDGEGNYTLRSDNGKEGVAAGAYLVSVSATKKDPKNEYAVPTSLIPQRYADPKRFGHAVQVADKAPPETYEIKLTP